jgi:hypothetical protein
MDSKKIILKDIYSEIENTSNLIDCLTENDNRKEIKEIRSEVLLPLLELEIKIKKWLLKN